MTADGVDTLDVAFTVLILIAVVLFVWAAMLLRRAHVGYTLVSLGLAALSAAFLFRDVGSQ